MPKVSILIPIKSNNPFMRESLLSTVAAMSEEMELILVDDQAEAQAKGLMEEITRTPSKKIKKITSKGSGIVDALHTGLLQAEGEYIGRMDADDSCANDRFVKQAQFLDLHPAYGLVSSYVTYGGDTRKNPGFKRFVEELNLWDTHEKMYANRFSDAVVAHPSVMFRKSLLKKANYRKTNRKGKVVPEDFDLWLRWLNLGVKFAKIPEYLLVWNDLPKRLSRNHPSYAKGAFRNAAAEGFPYAVQRKFWICGTGNTVEKRLRPFKANGLIISGFIGLTPDSRPDKLPVIPLEAIQTLPDDAFILVFVGNVKGKKYLRHFFDQHGLAPEKNYLWMV